MQGNAGAWVRLPLRLLEDERLQRSDLIICALLLDRCDLSPELSLTVDQIAQLSQLSPRTVRRSLQRLSDCGYIGITRTGRAHRISVLEILPPKRRSGKRAGEPALSKREQEEMNDYLSLVNTCLYREENAS